MPRGDARPLGIRTVWDPSSSQFRPRTPFRFASSDGAGSDGSYSCHSRPINYQLRVPSSASTAVNIIVIASPAASRNAMALSYNPLLPTRRRLLSMASELSRAQHCAAAHDPCESLISGWECARELSARTSAQLDPGGPGVVPRTAQGSSSRALSAGVVCHRTPG